MEHFTLESDGQISRSTQSDGPEKTRANIWPVLIRISQFYKPRAVGPLEKAERRVEFSE